MEITPQYVKVNMPSNLRPVHPQYRMLHFTGMSGCGFISLTRGRYVA
jgi:hypothetical protein